MTGSSPDHQLARGAPAIAADDGLSVRGLLHDLGHQMMTLSLLADSVREDSALSAESRQRMELVMQEMLRILDIIADAMPTDPRLPAAGAVDIRLLANEVANLAGLAYATTVIVEPGGPAVIRMGASLMWRVLANLVDNAVRAAGPRGRVDIRIEQGLDTVLEVTDNGPGFGGDPARRCGPRPYRGAPATGLGRRPSRRRRCAGRGRPGAGYLRPGRCGPSRASRRRAAGLKLDAAAHSCALVHAVVVDFLNSPRHGTLTIDKQPGRDLSGCPWRPASGDKTAFHSRSGSMVAGQAGQGMQSLETGGR